MKVLIACEFSGTVRDAFLAAGHDAMSADLLPTTSPGPHYVGDARDLLDDGYDLLIAHPPCTDLATSGRAHFAAKRADGRQLAALNLVRDFLDAPIPRVCVENPRSIITSHIRKPDQMISPWQHGHGEEKQTMLWLRNLPLLRPSDLLPPVGPRGEDWRAKRLANLGQSPSRWIERSKTFPGIARAMADQWGSLSVPAQRCTSHAYAGDLALF